MDPAAGGSFGLTQCRFDEPPATGSLVFDTLYDRKDPCIFLGVENATGTATWLVLEMRRFRLMRCDHVDVEKWLIIAT